LDAAGKYVQHAAAPKLQAQVEAYKELSERLILDFGMNERRSPAATSAGGAAVGIFGHQSLSAGRIFDGPGVRRRNGLLLYKL
jgi:hypothetical protein